ncbi:E3 ubiquitin-protein ligase PUB24 [Linum grandiflorum]
MEDIEIPEYFICPISLQMMKDPVTAITGITYDRDSIEQWLNNSPPTTAVVCPVSKQPLPRNSELTPNHTLRRLIQGWCTLNAQNRIPTPKPPLTTSHVVKLLRDLNNSSDGDSSSSSLNKLDSLASESDRNRACIAESGAAKSMVSFILKRCKERRSQGLEQALRVSNLALNHTPEPALKLLVRENEGQLITSLTWIIKFCSNQYTDEQAICLLNRVIRFASASCLERLDLDFFDVVVSRVMGKPSASKLARRSALQMLIEACPWGANRAKMVEANAVHHLIEMELQQHSKQMTELAFDLLARLCTIADGREKLLGHAAGLAVVAKKTLRVSAATDDRSVQIMGMISKLGAGKEEMLRSGAVTKLCMVIQADSASYLKDQARKILREHSSFWNNSPCVALYLLTWYPPSH